MLYYRLIYCVFVYNLSLIHIYPGAAKTGDELRADIEQAFTLIPGKHKINLHAIYAEFDGEPVDRDKIEPKHFKKWVDWAKKLGIGLDFNGT